MSGTSSRISSSTSALGIRSYTYPDLGSSSSESPARSVAVPQWLREPGHPLLVGVRDDQRPVAVLKDLLEHDDLANRLVALGDDHGERLVQHHFLAGPQLVGVHRGADVDAHLAAAGEHVRGAVLAAVEEDAEAGRRLGQPVHFLFQRHDLVARLAQRVGHPLVLPVDGRQPRLGLAEPLLEQPGLPRRVGQPTAQNRDFLLQEGDLRREALDLVIMPSRERAVITSGHVLTSIPRAGLS